ETKPMAGKRYAILGFRIKLHGVEMLVDIPSYFRMGKRVPIHDLTPSTPIRIYIDKDSFGLGGHLFFEFFEADPLNGFGGILLLRESRETKPANKKKQK